MRAVTAARVPATSQAIATAAAVPSHHGPSASKACRGSISRMVAPSLTVEVTPEADVSTARVTRDAPRAMSSPRRTSSGPHGVVMVSGNLAAHR